MLLTKANPAPLGNLFTHHFSDSDKGQTRHKPVAQVVTAVLVCNAWLALNDTQASSDWALKIIQKRWPTIKLAAQSKIEVIVGYTGNAQKAKMNMADLLQILAQRIGYDLAHYQIEQFDIHWFDPDMEVWCLVALHR